LEGGVCGRIGKEEQTAQAKLSPERSLQLKLMTIMKAHTDLCKAFDICPA